jgi:hypothetical protein
MQAKPALIALVLALATVALSLIFLAAGCSEPSAAPSPHADSNQTQVAEDASPQPATPQPAAPKEAAPKKASPLSPREVAERASASGHPIGAEELIKAYGVLTGPAAQSVDEGEVAGKHGSTNVIGMQKWQCGEGLNEIMVTEYLVEGETCEIVVEGWRRTDRYDQLRQEDIDSIHYGYETDMQSGSGLTVTDPTDIRSLCDALREGSFVEESSSARRSWQVGDGPVKHSRWHTLMTVGYSFPPGLGLHIHLKSGEGEHVPCYIHGDRCDGPGFRNDLLGQALKQIKDRQGVKLPGDAAL